MVTRTVLERAVARSTATASVVAMTTSINVKARRRGMPDDGVIDPRGALGEPRPG